MNNFLSTSLEVTVLKRQMLIMIVLTMEVFVSDATQNYTNDILSFNDSTSYDSPEMTGFFNSSDTDEATQNYRNDTFVFSDSTSNDSPEITEIPNSSDVNDNTSQKDKDTSTLSSNFVENKTEHEIQTVNVKKENDDQFHLKTEERLKNGNFNYSDLYSDNEYLDDDNFDTGDETIGIDDYAEEGLGLDGDFSDDTNSEDK